VFRIVAEINARKTMLETSRKKGLLCFALGRKGMQRRKLFEGSKDRSLLRFA